jgi:acetolactate synthase small subunit
MRDCSIQLTHRPGDLARVAQALAWKGVNLKALAAIAVDGQAVARIIPDDIEAARSAFRESNIRFAESEVHVLLLENKAGQLAAVATRLGEAGVNLEALYLTGVVDDMVEIAFVCDNPKKAKKVLEEF